MYDERHSCTIFPAFEITLIYFQLICNFVAVASTELDSKTLRKSTSQPVVIETLSETLQKYHVRKQMKRNCWPSRQSEAIETFPKSSY